MVHRRLLLRIPKCVASLRTETIIDYIECEMKNYKFYTLKGEIDCAYTIGGFYCLNNEIKGIDCWKPWKKDNNWGRILSYNMFSKEELLNNTKFGLEKFTDCEYCPRIPNDIDVLNCIEDGDKIVIIDIQYII